MKNKILSHTRDFLRGSYFPPFMGALALISHIFALEAVIAPLIVASCILVLLLLDDAKYTLAPIAVFTYLLSRKHTPTTPSYSDYLVSPLPLAIIILMSAALILAIVYFFVKNREKRKIRFSGEYALIALLVFALGLIITALPTGGELGKNLAFAFAEAAALLIPFLLFRFGTDTGEGEKFTDYLSYVALVSSSVIILELIYLFITGEVVSDGAISKEAITLGWGIWNSVGGMLTLSIPLLFLGALRTRHTLLYFLMAVASYAFAVLTLSRNALLFGTLAFGVCSLVCAFVGEKKRFFRCVLLSLVGIIAIFMLVFGEKVMEILADYINRGFSDNGRFALFGEAVSAFLSSPLLGGGFHGYAGEYYQFAQFMPRLPHNTPLAVLGGGGILLSLLYIGYRVSTVIPFIKRPTLTKTLLGITALLLVLQSLLDNFFWNFYPTFFYTAAICIALGGGAEK